MSKAAEISTPRTAVEFNEFTEKLWIQLTAIPPNSRFSFECVTNAKGEIHNHRTSITEDKGPLTLSRN